MSVEVAAIYRRLEERGIPTVKTFFARYDSPNEEEAEKHIRKQGAREFLALDFPQNFLAKVGNLDSLHDKMSIPEFEVGSVEITIGNGRYELGALRVELKDKTCQEISGRTDERYRDKVIKALNELGYKFIECGKK